jgi:hypothetical protein
VYSAPSLGHSYPASCSRYRSERKVSLSTYIPALQKIHLDLPSKAKATSIASSLIEQGTCGTNFILRRLPTREHLLQYTDSHTDIRLVQTKDHIHKYFQLGPSQHLGSADRNFNKKETYSSIRSIHLSPSVIYQQLSCILPLWQNHTAGLELPDWSRTGGMGSFSAASQ